MANIASPDLSVFSNIKTVSDFDRLRQEFEMKKQLQQAQMQKAGELDLDKIGETAFAKLSMGQPLSPLEQAGAQFIQNKSGGQYLDAMGNPVQKPKIFDNVAGFGGMGGQAQPSLPQPQGNPQPDRLAPLPNGQPDNAAGAVNYIFGGDGGNAPTPQPQQNEWDIEAQNQIAAAAGNPKLQQDLRSTYAKSKMEMNADQSKNAGFADRLVAANPIIKKTTKAALDPTQRFKNSILVLGNYIVSSDYQSFNQGQRDFINAQLRRESGAVISPSEFDNAEKQYFPTPGDDDNTLAQKEANRESAVKAMQRSAGPAYKSTAPTNPLQQEFDAKKGYQATPSGIKYRVVK